MKDLNTKILSTGIILATGIVLAVLAMWLPSCSTDVGGDEDRTAPIVTIDAITDADDADGEIIGEATIHWTTNEPNPSRVDIYLSSDSGENYDTTIALDVPDTGTYVWDTNTVPDCRACRLRIIARDVVGNVSEPGDSREDFIINNVPQVLGSAFYTDLNHDGPGDGDTIRVPFDKDVELLTSIASDIFFFPVLGDNIGPFATVEKNIKQNELVITFNDLVPTDFHLHVRGQFDQEKLNRTAPSGLNLRDNLALGILVAKDTGRTAAPAKNGIDIAPTFNDSGQPLDSELLEGVSVTQSVVIGDVDGDGAPELITGNGGILSEPNRVWRNNDGKFTSPSPVDELGNNGTYSLALGDVDGDGDLDLVAGNQGENWIWRNDNGVFNDSVHRLGDSSTQSVALDDVDGDGDPDLITGNGGGPNLVWRNDDGRFDFILDEVGASITVSVVLGDVEGDGDSDLISGNFGMPNQVWLNDGSGTFRNSDPLDDTDTISLALGDIDGDGDDDLVVGNSNGPDSVWRNNEGVFNRVQQVGYRSTTDVVFADVDDDGDLDLITANSPREPNRVWLNNINNMPGERGVFTDSGQLLGNSNTQSVALDDVDGDSDLDLIAGNTAGQNRIWLSSGRSPHTALFVDSLQALGNRYTGSVALGDIDGDRDLDLVAGNSGDVEFDRANRVWRNDDGGYTEVQLLGNSNTRSVALGDVDGDGDLDLVAGNDGPNRIWLNDGLGKFTEAVPGLGDSSTRSVALGDVDGDGDIDLVAGNDGPNLVWRNDDGVFNVILDEVGISNTRSVAMEYVDGDDRLDLVTGNDGPNRIWLNDGLGKFTEAVPGLGDSSTRSVALGDVDGDGDIDLVAGNDGPNLVWRNDDGVFNVILDEVGISNTRSVAMEYVDGDDRLDLVTGNDGPNRIWLNDGLGKFTEAVPGLGDSSTRSVALRDVDGDGDSDLVSGNTDRQPNRVWLNNVYNSPEQKGVFTEAGPELGDSSTTSLTVGDVDSDGDLDFVAGNDGANRIWLNDY